MENWHAPHFLTKIASSNLSNQLNCNSSGLPMSNLIKLMTGYSPPGTSIVMLLPFSRIWSSFVIFLPSGVVSLSNGRVYKYKNGEHDVKLPYV